MCAAMLCMSCGALAACGSQGGSASASASASSSAASATDKFVGEWKLAGAETQGITVAGDFSQLIGTSMTMGLTIAADGTGTFSYNGQAVNVAWEASGDDAITLKGTEPETSASAASASADAASASASADANASAEAAAASAGADAAAAASGQVDSALQSAEGVKVAYRADVEALAMEITEQSMTLTALFTADGKLSGMPEISAEAAQPITSESDLLGSWKLSGMNMMGITMYGDISSLAAIAGESGTDTSLVLEEGGKGTMSGSAVTWTVGPEGATISEGGMNTSAKMLNGELLIDLSAATGVDMQLVYAK
ncbi:MAG TPA: hypothetical protein DCP91_13180 [Eggerthellaceae bacterium]|nr:hypothetical protein [Eggerthellaceae bacterium]